MHTTHIYETEDSFLKSGCDYQQTGKCTLPDKVSCVHHKIGMSDKEEESRALSMNFK